MDSSTKSPFPPNTTLSLGTRVNVSMLEQQREIAASSYARRGASPLSATRPAYRCKFCPRTFKCPRSLGGHQKAHKDLREALYKPPRHAWSPASNWQSSSHATSMRRAQFIEWAIHYYHPFSHPVMASFPGQTGNGGLAPVHLSSPAPAVVDGYRGTGDGSRLGGLREVNQEETADGIDLTLKL